MWQWWDLFLSCYIRGLQIYLLIVFLICTVRYVGLEHSTGSGIGIFHWEGSHKIFLFLSCSPLGVFCCVISYLFCELSDYPDIGTDLSPVQIHSVAQSCVTLCDPMICRTPGFSVHHKLPEFTQTQCLSSQWCHVAISSSLIPFTSCPQLLPAPESFPMSQLFTWGGQSTRVSALASFLPKKSQGWSLSEWTGWISLQSKGLSRVFSNTTVQKHQFFSTQPSSQSKSHIHTWPQEKP